MLKMVRRGGGGGRQRRSSARIEHPPHLVVEELGELHGEVRGDAAHEVPAAESIRTRIRAEVGT
jgi:hypothetical protein